MPAKRKNYSQGEMRPLSALSKSENASPKKKTSPVRVPEPAEMPYYSAEGIQNTVSALAGQNKQTDADTIHPTPLHAAKSSRQTEAASNESASDININVNTAEEAFTEAAKAELMSDMSGGNVSYYERTAPERSRYHTRRRGAQAPDLTDKASRDAFFSRYTSAPAADDHKPEEKPEADAAEEILREEERKREEQLRKSRSPFNRPLDRPVISHAKEEELSVYDDTASQTADAPEPLDEITAPPEMREAIEGMMRQQRQERENSRIDRPSDEMQRAGRVSDIIQITVILAAIILCAVFMLFGDKLGASAEECSPAFSSSELFSESGNF